MVGRAWFHLLGCPGPAGIEPRPHRLPGRLPAGHPAVLDGELANDATDTGLSPSSCRRHRNPAGPPCSCPASTQPGRGGAAHHDPAPGTAAVEELFHGRIARQVQDTAWWSERIKAMPGEAQAPQGRWPGGRPRGHCEPRLHSHPGRTRARNSARPGRRARGQSARPGSAPGSSRRARAAATRRWSTGRAGSRPSQTSHSSSTPTCPGGPVLKAIRAPEPPPHVR